ncbi:MAG: hypothetical protein ACXW61_11970 [Gemmatirosa sp.]
MPGADRLLELVIALTVDEGAVLAAYRAVTGRGLPHRELAAFLGAGLALLVAMRLATGGAPRAAFAAAMLTALALHLWLVAQRWQR